MQLEQIGKVVKDSLEHGNTVSEKTLFTGQEIEVIAETIKAAFEEYHQQITKD